MKLLAISDIHGQTHAVHRLRALEGNTFDSILVAGDIGRDLVSTSEVFLILSSFNCPILYVYGNWDHSLAYNYSFAENAHHLHNKCFALGDFVFAGFSGVPENWGANPWVAPVTDAILARQNQSLAAIKSQIATEEEALNRLLATKSDTSAETEKTFSARVKSKRQELNMLRGKRTRLEASHQRELDDRFKDIIEANRKALLERMAPYSQNRTIVITHGRLTRTAQDMPEVPLFLFGHTHGYTNTRIKQSQFINVSALDHVVPVMPEQSTERLWKVMRGADIGAYTVIEISKDEEIRAASYPLWIIPPGWKRISGFAHGLSPLAQVDVGTASGR